MTLMFFEMKTGHLIKQLSIQFWVGAECESKSNTEIFSAMSFENLNEKLKEKCIKHSLKIWINENTELFTI